MSAKGLHAVQYDVSSICQGDSIWVYIRLDLYITFILRLKIPDRIPTEELHLHVRVKVHIICVHMVLDHMLMNPVDLGSPDPVFCQAKKPVDPGISADGAVISMMLDVETWM